MKMKYISRSLFGCALIAALLVAVACTTRAPTSIHIANLEITAGTIDGMVAQLESGARGDKEQTIKALVALMGKVAPFNQLSAAQKQQLAEQLWLYYFGGGSGGGGGSPAEPEPPAPSPGNWIAKTQNQMLFYGAPNYFFHTVPEAEARRFTRKILAEGLTGPSFEFCGQPCVDEYNGKKYPVNLDALYDAAFNAFAPYLAEAKAGGGVVKISFLNSNQSYANGKPDSWWKARAVAFVQRFGTANILILPLNETDSRGMTERTRASVGTAIRSGLIEAGFPRAQLIGYGSKGDNGFWEHHPQKSDASDLKGGGHTTINTTDSGKSIAHIYGSDWRNGGKPNTGNIGGYAQRVRKSGTSGEIYAFMRAPDYTGLAAAGAGWRARSLAPVSVDTSVRRAAVVAGCRTVNAEAYGGWNGDCPGADVDARAFAALCERAGITDTTLLLNEAATLPGIYSNAAFYVHGMGDGDLLVLYFSGHGGQVNSEDGDEADGKDETICLWDGELSDDYVAELLAELPAGLRVFFVTDNCNSGSNYRKRSYTRTATQFRGALIHYGGCADGLSSYGDERGGLFTTAASRTWGRRATYATWFSRIAGRMPRMQVPTYSELGTVTDDFRNTPALR